ncbi:hypothetical protein X771_26810 [Mesorhizobium sp. LSJC277A00]|nr:hypothetical protein X771_26810 [Mesorhizobium sp. LSJC277A00]
MASDKVLDMIHGALIAHGIDAVRRDRDVMLQSKQLRFEAEVFETSSDGWSWKSTFFLRCLMFSRSLNPLLASATRANRN